jgi:tight adherence protein C
LSPLLPGLAAAVLLVVAAALLIGSEVSEHRLSDRVRRAALGTGPVIKQRRSLLSILGGLLRAIEVSGIVNSLASPKDKAQVERTLAPFGIPAATAHAILVATKLVFLILAPAVAIGWHYLSERQGSILLPLMIGAAAGIMLPNMIVSQLRKRNQNILNRAMADTLDLLVVCAEAGLGLESAIDRVAADLRKATPEMAMEFAQLSQEMRMMPDRSQAMERFAERAEVEGLRRLASTLAQAMRYGTPLGQALRALAADQRQDRMTRLEEKAARLPALLVVPLIVFILPPLFLVLVGPSMLQLFDALGTLPK